MELEDKASLRVRLREEAVDNAERDIAIAAEWFPLEEEAAQRCETTVPSNLSRSPDS
jgi:hypothetical protein